MKVYRGLTISVAIGNSKELSHSFRNAESFQSLKERGSTEKLNNISARVGESAIVIFNEYCNKDAYGQEILLIKKIDPTRVIGLCDFREKPKDVDVYAHVKAFAGWSHSTLLRALNDPTALHLKIKPSTSIWQSLSTISTQALAYLSIETKQNVSANKLLKFMKTASNLRTLRVRVAFDQEQATQFLSHFFGSKMHNASSIDFPESAAQKLAPLRDHPSKHISFNIIPSNGCNKYEPYQALSFHYSEPLDLISKGTLAIMKKRYDYLAKLLKEGLNPLCICKIAFQLRDTDAIKTLVENGLQLDDCKDLCIKTIEEEQYDFLKVLVELGLNPQIVSQAVIASNHKKIIALMVEHGLYLTPAEIRRYKSHEEAILLYKSYAPPEKPLSEIEQLRAEVKRLTYRVGDLEDRLRILEKN